jgi:hypothetical protein
LSYFFLDQAGALRAACEEAAMSRLYGGIHYRFDNEIGLTLGRSIGQLAIQRTASDGG